MVLWGKVYQSEECWRPIHNLFYILFYQCIILQIIVTVTGILFLKWVQIAMLSWWQRKAASAFVAEPPTSSIEEALENFLKVESKKKCYYNIKIIFSFYNCIYCRYSPFSLLLAWGEPSWENLLEGHTSTLLNCCDAIRCSNHNGYGALFLTVLDLPYSHPQQLSHLRSSSPT